MKALSGRDIADIAVRNAVPVAGMVLFGWNAANLVILYYLDTLVSLAAAAWAHEPDQREGMGFGVLVFGGIFGGWAFFSTYGQVTCGWPLVAGGLIQIATASLAFAEVRRSRTSLAKADFESALWQRMVFVGIRWVLAIMLGMAWTPAVIVVIYAAVTVFYEVAWRDRERAE